MHWIREGTDWVLKFNRRKLGRVFPDDRYPGMCRSRRADGQLSDMANLSWAKHAVLAAAERDILPAAERAFSPPKPQQKRTPFETKSSYVAPIEPGVGCTALVPVHGAHSCAGHLLRSAKGFRAFDTLDREISIYSTPDLAADALLELATQENSDV